MVQKKQSNKIIRGLVIELKPDNTQKLILDKHLNNTRFIYNEYVEEYLKLLKKIDFLIIRIIRNYVRSTNFWKVYIHGLFNKLNISS